MVEYSLQLDSIFNSLADPTRRDILRRLAAESLSVGEIAAPYGMTFAAISKHVKVLEGAKLISKHRQGKQQFVSLSPTALKEANDYLGHYQELWSNRFDALNNYLKEGSNGQHQRH